jgi:predicted RNA binding protein YcfA (HicA-like mRNA interferase family)
MPGNPLRLAARRSTSYRHGKVITGGRSWTPRWNEPWVRSGFPFVNSHSANSAHSTTGWGSILESVPVRPFTRVTFVGAGFLFLWCHRKTSITHQSSEAPGSVNCEDSRRDQDAEDDGWSVVRQRGSHRQFKHASKPGLVTVAGKPGDDLAPGTLNSVLKHAGLKQ